jgi:hypothetical protein
MSGYINLRLSGEPQRVLHADDDHTVVEIAVNAARDIALHGYMSQSAEIIAPMWDFDPLDDKSRKPSFSHNFVRDTISTAGLEMLWRKAGFIPKNIYGWRCLLDDLGYTDEQLEVEQRDYFCISSSYSTKTSLHHASAAPTSGVSQWAVIQNMLAVQTNSRK